jgi:hemin uptake protein HemP
VVTDAQQAEPSAAPAPFLSDRLEIAVLRSTELFAGRREICIEHAGQLYRLRITRSGKLILQK